MKTCDLWCRLLLVLVSVVLAISCKCIDQLREDAHYLRIRCTALEHKVDELGNVAKVAAGYDYTPLRP